MSSNCYAEGVLRTFAGKKEVRVLIFENVERHPKGRQKALNDFESKISPTGNKKKGKGIKILTSKSMLQRLPLSLAQIIQIIQLKTYYVKSVK